MSKVRDKSQDLKSVFPPNDPKYKKWFNEHENIDQKSISRELSSLVSDYFRNDRLLEEMYVDKMERTKVRWMYRILTFFGKRKLKVKVRLPQKPNIYYIDTDWYKTGDYHVDPVEIWWSDHGQNVLKNWKTSCNVQRAPFDREQFMEDHKIPSSTEESSNPDLDE